MADMQNKASPPVNGIWQNPNIYSQNCFSINSFLLLQCGFFWGGGVLFFSLGPKKDFLKEVDKLSRQCMLA